MIKSILPFICLLIFINSHAQLRVAITGGGHLSTVKETNDVAGWDDSKYSGRTGLHFGMLADLQLAQNSRYHIQPSVNFYNKGRRFASDYDTSLFSYSRIESEQYINYVEIPVNFVFKSPIGKWARVFVGAGPYFSFFYSGKEKTSTYLKSGSVVTEENTDPPVGNAPGKYETFDIGINGVAGIEFKRVFISLNASRGLTSFYNAGYDGSFKHQVLGGTIGIFIGQPVPIDPRFKDRDEDGIKDSEDSCMEDAGPIVTMGCPDTDGDGIADIRDKCPDQKGLLRYEGCPITDTDNDGIADLDDNCKEIAGLERYNGCPVPDSDGDGINDETDSCVTVRGLERYNGCPEPDRDQDGVGDETDSCPDTAGVRENNGCPLIQAETIEKVNYAAKKIQFRLGKAELTTDSYSVLDELVVLLDQNARLLLDIEGHTSAEGSLSFNMKLSQQRAETVKNYLVSKGIATNRLTATGFGPTRPLNEGKTEEEKAINRRVEINVRNN